MNDRQVATMARENSGVQAKLRTYASQRAYTMIRSLYTTGTGVTLDLDHHAMGPASKTTGYWVGGKTQAHGIPLPGDVRPFVRALSATYTALNGTGYVGVWKHNGTAIVEGVEWLETLEDATRVARERGEFAIFDIANKTTIFLD